MKKKRIKKRKIIGLLFMIIGVCVAVTFSVGYAFAYYTLSKIPKVEINEEEIVIKEEVVEKLQEYDEKITNIALFGIDAEDGQRGRSDAIMIATIDTVNKSLKLTSIMRDSYVNIGNRGLDKINHAYAFGGPELAISTLNENFDLNISDFAAVNFSTLPKLIDILGGVEIEITSEEVSHIDGIYSPGTYNLTGNQALSYTRIRYASGGDYKRTERQRTVLEKMFEKVKDLSVPQLTNLLNDVLPMISTSLSSNEILSLASSALMMNISSLEQERFPLDGYCQGKMINGIYYLTFDKETTVNQMHEYLFENKKIWVE